MTSRGKVKSAKDIKSGATDKNENTENLAAAFTLPDSLPCSEVEFPVLIQRRMKANWKHILDDSNKSMKEIEEYAQSKVEKRIACPFLKTECDYIQREVFILLLPALEETLNKAKLWDAFTRPQCFFNGIDHVVQLLWNSNPRYPERRAQQLHVFNFPWVQQWLKLHPRPYYPKSWLWPEDYAATLIQKTVRQYFVQRDEEVQEMRDFWRVSTSEDEIMERGWIHVALNCLRLIEGIGEKLELERNISAMDLNPFLAKFFASQPRIHKK